MSRNIIDDVENLMKLSEEELNEILLDEKYNKANLRELVRRVLGRAKTYKDAYEYQRLEKEKAEDNLESFKSKIKEL